MDKRKMMWSFIISSFFRNNYVFCLIILCIAFILGKGELNPWEGQKMFPPMNKTGIVHEYTLVLRKERLEGHLKVQYTINHTVPGPLILIPLGDSVAITVINEIPNDATTLHWHGMTLSKEGYNDGVVGLTQCSIKNTTAMNTFTYR